jgi:transposase InsO family protein
VSIRQSCAVVGALRSTQYYRSRRPDDSPLRMRLRELAAARRRFGYRRPHVMFLGAPQRDEGLNVEVFRSLDHARATLLEWKLDYNDRRPHGSLEDLTPT